MKKTLVSIASLAALISGTSAMAASLTNYESSDQTVIITEGNNKTTVTLAPENMVDEICMQGCLLELPNGDEYEIAANEIASIEGGKIYIDGIIDESTEGSPPKN